jgi:galactonate dehydratase
MDMTIQDVEMITVEVPLRDIPHKHMRREIPHWTVFEIHRVTLKCGVVGFGETMAYYTWGRTSDDTRAKAVGKNAAELMWDDSMGAGLQIALFDAVGRAMDVPVNRLLGKQVRERAHLSWWDIDMSAEDWISECQLAISEGYVSFKTKARPWYDLEHQVKTLCATLPDYFSLDMDFNMLLVDTAHATRVLMAVDKHPNVHIYESPTSQADVIGNRFLRGHTSVAIAHHYGQPAMQTSLADDVADGYVVSGGASTVMAAGHVCDIAHKPFWLQLVGTSITATFSLHLAAVIDSARWPAVNCHQLYAQSLIDDPLAVSVGLAKIPEGPGLGVELDMDAVENLRVEPHAAQPYPYPDILIAIQWPTGATSYYTHAQQYWHEFASGRLPIFLSGVNLEMVENDGSPEWREMRDRADKEDGVHSDGRPL